MRRPLYGERYVVNDELRELADFIQDRLHTLSFKATCKWYKTKAATLGQHGKALLGCNDRFYLLTSLLHRMDAYHPWLFDRIREVEADPDGHIDLWARYHYKSTIVTFAGAIQEILRDPNIKICIFSVTEKVAKPFLRQIKEELESNTELQAVYSDVLSQSPRKEAASWSLAAGLTVKRMSNPKEATIEAYGLIDGMPTGRHFDLHIYDDLVTQDNLSEDLIKKTTERWEMADNLGSHDGCRKWIVGTRYHFADTYGVILKERRGNIKPRIYPATDDGSLEGDPVFLKRKRWDEVKSTQRSTVSAQMLLNPIAGNEATFKASWFRPYEVVPNGLNVYIMCDPSKGTTQRSDRTAIAVIGIDMGGNKYFLDGYRHRMKLSDRYEFLKQLRAKWEGHEGVEMVKVGYEQYGQVNDLDVITEYQQRDGIYFQLEELNTPKQGKFSKDDRIERLEPDMRNGLFYLPALVWNADANGAESLCFWSVWTEGQRRKFEKEAIEEALATGETKKSCPYTVGEIIYHPAKGLTNRQRAVKRSRIAGPVKRRDENNKVYDLTVAFMDEALRHPFAVHDDLIDAASRVYDMEPMPPMRLPPGITDPAITEDAAFGDYVEGDVVDA